MPELETLAHMWAVVSSPGPSNYPLLDYKYHQIRTIRFQLRVVGRSRQKGIIRLGLDGLIQGLLTIACHTLGPWLELPR